MLIRHIARILVGVAFAATSLMLASPGALAHAGHPHAQYEAPVPSHATVNVHVRAAQSHAHGPHWHFHGAYWHVHASGGVPAELAAMSGGPGEAPEKSHDCSGWCCCMGVGHSAAIAPPIALVGPGTRAPTPEARSDGGAGITPDALPEPPRTLA